MPSKPVALPALAGALVVAMLATPPAPAQPPALQATAERLDILLLVDVSRSMFTSDGGFRSQQRPNGSDPDRLRWDAVQLVLNLLTAEDRVLVLPFNNQAPATATIGGQSGRIPGELPDELLPVSEHRPRLIQQVETFIHPEGALFPNTDSQGTAILGALTKAAEWSRAEPGRRRAVILLTDGREDEDQLQRFPGTQREADLQAYLGPWARPIAGRLETPVYTIGLGSEQAVRDGLLDLDYLRRIANLTGGDSTWVRQNRQLIETFRDLIWRLKNCWIKPVDMAAQRATEDTMRGIVDLGILAFAQQPDDRPGPRNTGPPTARIDFAWTTGDDRAPPAVRRAGKAGGGYAFTYFGRPSPSEKSPFQVFADAGLKLSTSWTPPALGHQITFAKRTARPLLEIVEPTELRSFSRHQQLTVRLQLSDTPYFQAEQFRLTMGLAPQGQEMMAAGGGATEVTQALDVDPTARTFRGTIRLDRLPRGSGPKDYYTLRLLAEGLRAPLHALSSYRLELPRRTIAVDNTLVLAAEVKRVELSRETPALRIPLRALAAIQGDLTLRVALTPPRSKADQRPVATESLILDQEVRLHDGTATLEVKLNPDRVPPSRVEYEDGQIELTAPAGVGLVPLTIPLGLRIGLVKLVSDPPECHLEAKADPDRSPPIRIVAGTPGGLPPETRDVRIALAVQGDGVSFSPEELWLERDAPGDRPGARSQTLDGRLGEPFRIAFAPQPGKVGRHAYTWTITARGANTATGALTLDYQTPRLLGPDRPIAIRTARGARREVAIPVGLEAPRKEEKRQVVFRPDRQADGGALFVREGGPAGGAVGQEPKLEVPAADEAVEVVSTGAGPGQAVVRLGLTIPDDLPLGRYRARGVLAGVQADVREAPVELEVIVNELEVLATPPGRDGPWEPCERVALGLFFDSELEQTVRVRTGLRDRLRPEHVRVTIPVPFENDDGDVISRVPAPPVADRDVRVLDGGEGMEMTIRFPPVGNAEPFKPYRVRAYFESPELELDRRVVEFVVTFLDSRFTGPPRPR